MLNWFSEKIHLPYQQMTLPVTTEILKLCSLRQAQSGPPCPPGLGILTHPPIEVLRLCPQLLSLYLLTRAANSILKTTEICFLTILEARSPKSRSWQGWFLPRRSAPGLSPWLLDDHLLPVSSSSFHVSTSPFFNESCWTGAHLKTSFLLDYLYRDSVSASPHKVTFWVLGVLRVPIYPRAGGKKGAQII